MPELYPGPLSAAALPSVDLWLLAMETFGPSDLNALQAVLSPSEQAKLRQMHRPAAQRHFVLSRGCLRHLLSRYTGQPPGSLTFVYGPRGKPALSAEAMADGYGPVFNLAHSGQRLLVAVSTTAAVRAIGVDLEALRPVSRLPGLCRRYLTPAEADSVLGLESASAEHRFLRYWTGKEACLKALGLGIVDSMQRLQLTLDTGLAAAGVVPVPVATSLPEHPGQLYQWQPEPGYVGAIALHPPPDSPADLRLCQITCPALGQPEVRTYLDVHH